MDRPSRGLIGGLVAALFLCSVGWAPPATAADLPSIAATYAVGASPIAVAITPDGSRIVTANNTSNDASIVNRATGTVATVPVGASPQGVVITPDGAKAFVSNYLGASATVIDLPGAAVLQTISLNPRPGQGAVSGDGSVVFIPSSFNPPAPAPQVNEIAKIQVATGVVSGTLTATLPGCLTAAPDGVTFLVCAAISNSVGLFTTSTAGAVSTASLPGGAATSGAFSPDSATAYVTNGVGDAVNVIDVATRTVTATTAVGDNPNSVAVHPSGGRVFVTNNGSGSLSVLSASGAVITTTPITGTPRQVAVSNDGQYVLVATSEGNLVVLDATGTQVLTTLALGGTPSDIDIAATGNFAAISLSDTNQVVIVDLPPAPASGDQVPTAALQQYAPAPGEACGENPPEAADFPALVGARTSGWGTSWAQWPNGGLGGVVCSRQPFYTSAGAWSVR